MRWRPLLVLRILDWIWRFPAIFSFAFLLIPCFPLFFLARQADTSIIEYSGYDNSEAAT